MTEQKDKTAFEAVTEELAAIEAERAEMEAREVEISARLEALGSEESEVDANIGAVAYDALAGDVKAEKSRKDLERRRSRLGETRRLLSGALEEARRRGGGLATVREAARRRRDRERIAELEERSGELHERAAEALEEAAGLLAEMHEAQEEQATLQAREQAAMSGMNAVMLRMDIVGGYRRGLDSLVRGRLGSFIEERQ